MAGAFQLTAPTADRSRRRRFELATGAGGPWQALTDGEFARLLERWATYPDDVRAELDVGHVVRLDRYQSAAGLSYYVRRAPSAAELDAAARQIRLL